MNSNAKACHVPQLRFIDNTDPAGIDHQIAQLGPELSSTLVVVISKVCIYFTLFLQEIVRNVDVEEPQRLCYLLQSGGTPETRNGLLEVQKAFREKGLDFSKQVNNYFSLCQTGSQAQPNVHSHIPTRHKKPLLVMYSSHVFPEPTFDLI